jgi:hypothetical protein
MGVILRSGATKNLDGAGEERFFTSAALRFRMTIPLIFTWTDY